MLLTPALPLRMKETIPGHCPVQTSAIPQEKLQWLVMHGHACWSCIGDLQPSQ
jgi:hypothetical protein